MQRDEVSYPVRDDRSVENVSRGRVSSRTGRQIARISFFYRPFVPNGTASSKKSSAKQLHKALTVKQKRSRIIQKHRKVVQNGRIVTQSQVKVAQNDRMVTQSQRIVTQSQGKVVQNDRMVTQSQVTIAHSHLTVTHSHLRVTHRHVMVADRILIATHTDVASAQGMLHLAHIDFWAIQTDFY